MASQPATSATADSDRQHPTTNELSEFASGRLDEAALSCIESHLEECPACCESLAGLSKSSDRFVDRLVSVAKAVGSPSENPSTTQGDSEGTIDSQTGKTAYRLPTSVGRFEVRNELGSGGFGVVLKCFDPQLQRDVAVKIPRVGSFANAEMRIRFLREAHAAATLDHPGIVPVFEAGEADGVCYIAAAYCSGTNLSQWLKDRDHPVDLMWATDLAIDLAEAVDHAHGRGVLHRDLKPSNILLNSDGMQPRVTDFGLAKLTDDGPETTRTGMVMGTLGYMSPEQAGGRSKIIAKATDVYSLGAILYELLTGRPPVVEESDSDALHRIIHDDPIAPSRLRPRLPRDLETICLTCLQKDPARRYESARLLVDDLQRYRDGQPILARPVGRTEKIVRWTRRKPALAAMAATVLLLLTALVGGSVFSSIRLAEQQQQTLAQLQKTRRAQRQAVEAGDRALQQERSAKEQLLTALMAKAKSRRLSGRKGQKFDALQAIGEATELVRTLQPTESQRLELRNEAIAALAMFDIQLEETWRVLPDDATTAGAVYDLNVDQYASISPEGELQVRRMRDNKRLWGTSINIPQPRFRHWVTAMAISPDGTYLAAHQGFDLPLHVWNLQLDQPLPGFGDASDPDCILKHFDFSLDSRTLACCTRSGSLVLVDLANGSRHTLAAAGNDCVRVSVAPTGDRLLVVNSSQVQVIDLASETVEIAIPTKASTAVWSSDGESIATGTQVGGVHIWDGNSGAQLVQCAGHVGSSVLFAAFLPGSRILSTTSWFDTRYWNALSGEQMLMVDQGRGSRFSDNGKWQTVGFGRSAGRYRVGSSDCYRTLNQNSLSGLQTSPDGKLLISIQPDELLLWQLPSGDLVGSIPIKGLADRQACFHSRDNAIVTVCNGKLVRWPYQWTENGPQRLALSVGSPTKIELQPPLNVSGVAAADDGRMLITGGYEVRVVDLSQRPATTIQQVAHSGWSMSASRNKRWLGTSAWQGNQVCLWDLNSGELAKSLDYNNAAVRFSPDSQTMGIGGQAEYQFYDLHTMKHKTIANQGFGKSGPLAFSKDGKWVAVSTSYGKIRLLDAHSLADIATFSLPTPETISEIHLTEDNRSLIAFSHIGVVHLWDLQKVRRSLAEFGLDWGEEPKNSNDVQIDSSESALTDSNAKIEFKLAKGAAEKLERSIRLAQQPNQDSLSLARQSISERNWTEALNSIEAAIEEATDDRQRAEALSIRYYVHQSQGAHVLALADCEKAYELEPDNPNRSNQLSWVLATCADSKLRDTKRAVELAKKSIELNPDYAGTWNSLGVAHYRCGDLDQAAEAFQQSIKLAGGYAYDFFVLAMIAAKQGNGDEASAWYAKAVAKVKADSDSRTDLMELWQEAKEVVAVE